MSMLPLIRCVAVFGLIVALLPTWPVDAAPPTDADMLAPWPHPRGYVCYRAAKPIAIDGSLDDAAWAAAPWTETFVDIEGDKRPAPRHRTRAKMLWDDEALYIAAELEEPHVWAKLTAHDSVIFQDPDFEVFLDPDGDNHIYGELELNARNTTWDLLLTKPYKDGGHAINAWEITGLKTAVRIGGTLNDPRDTDRGWTLEVRWPWNGLRELCILKDPKTAWTPPADGDRWRINFSRVEWDVDVVEGQYVKVKGKPEHNWVWAPQGVIDMHRPERWGYLQFSTAAPGQAQFQPDPDWTTRDQLHRLYYAQRKHRTANGAFSQSVAELGLKDANPVIEMQATRRGFEASSGTKPRRWTITDDALFRRE